MKKTITLCLFLTICLSCAVPQPHNEIGERPTNGRERIFQAIQSPEMTGVYITKFGLVSTALSSANLDPANPLKSLGDHSVQGRYPIHMKLLDGTIIGGLLFMHPGETADTAPLLMASFGFLQDRWGSEAAKFYDLYIGVESYRIPAHVLILDHPTSGPFLANNGNLSIGAYDDARMWIEIAQRVRKTMAFKEIHLLGVSMSGQTVVNALIEDKRLGLNLFRSGLVFSIAPNFNKAPGKQFAQLTTRKGVDNPWRRGIDVGSATTTADSVQNQGMWMLINKQFIPNYRRIRPGDEAFEIKRNGVPVFFWTAFENRISFLQKANRVPDTWNYHDFSIENLNAYLASTQIAGIIKRVKTPLVMISSHDDPAVPHDQFENVKKAANANPWVLTYETNYGGHFGFDITYGKEYIGRIIRLMLDPEVHRSWNELDN